MRDERSRIRELLGLKSMDTVELRDEIKRTPWDITFLRHAVEASHRSHDADTQCGCVLTIDNTILSSGYNGFIRGIDDTVLPNKRPHKYPFMLHAELNAVLNCARQGKSTLGATCYVTTKPCFACLQMVWQAGIEKIVYTDWSVSKNYNHSEADDQIDALMALINPPTISIGELDGTIRECRLNHLTMEFIDKNDVLPN